MASVLATLCLAGIQSVFRDAVRLESRATAGWEARASAEAIVDHLMHSVECATNLPDVPTLLAASDSEGGVFICQAGLERRRYRWRKTANGASDLTIQTMVFPGPSVLPEGVALEQLDDEKTWESVPSTLIGSDVQGIGVSVRELDPKKSEEEKKKNHVGTTVVTVSASAGGGSASRTLVLWPSNMGQQVGGQSP